jgi:hypothetical protein
MQWDVKMDTRSVPHRRKNRKGYVALAIIIIIIIAALAAILRGNGFIPLATEKSIILTQAPTLVDMKGTYFSLNLASYTNSTAKVYVSEFPIFVNQEAEVSLSIGNTTHIGLGTKYSDLGIRLNSISTGKLNVTLIPIDPSLGIAIDSGKIVYINSLPAVQNSSSPIKIIITNSTSTAPSSISTVSTTTIKPVNNTSKVMSVVEKSIWYPLMLNYSQAYANTSACTPQLYNSSYIAYHSSAPSGPNTYQNVSIFVPYKMNSTITSVGGNEYADIYTAYSHSAHTTGEALAISVNISSMTISSVVLSGVFQGDNYTTLYNGYRKSISIGNACGIEIV